MTGARPTWTPMQNAGHGQTDPPPHGYYFEPPTRPLHARREEMPTSPARPSRRRVEPSVVLAALVMCALAIGVIVGLATM
ncbi:hypothetical protein [Gordonia rhizosphera]|uniref:hypothetical protein n=1 Tax=Gordonia rhizosphera TaxID=83341 RepID=UPI0012F6B110|nr:hypothetical protein [Gordonia rhizosphera]